jgi:hypothetical protein
MDVETSEAIDGLSNRIDALGLELRGEMATQGMSLRGEIATQGAELRAELRAEMVAMRQELSAEIRHVQIQVESLRDDIRIIAEGVATLAVKLDRL